MNLPFSQTLPEKWLFGSNQKEVKNPKEDKQKKLRSFGGEGEGEGERDKKARKWRGN